MTITKVYVAINEESEEYTAQSDFDFEVFFITEYISRNLKKYKFKYGSVNKLIIRMDSTGESVVHEPEFNSLRFNTSYSYRDFNKLNGTNRTQKILELIDKASLAYESHIPGIHQVMRSSIDSFRSDNYKNTWRFKKKRIPGIGEVELICELDRDAFSLTIVARHNGVEVLKREILKTKPSSIIYHHKFKDILFDGERIMVSDRFDEPIYQVSISEINSK